MKVIPSPSGYHPPEVRMQSQMANHLQELVEIRMRTLTMSLVDHSPAGAESRELLKRYYTRFNALDRNEQDIVVTEIARRRHGQL